MADENLCLWLWGVLPLPGLRQQLSSRSTAVGSWYHSSAQLLLPSASPDCRPARLAQSRSLIAALRLLLCSPEKQTLCAKGNDVPLLIPAGLGRPRGWLVNGGTELPAGEQRPGAASHSRRGPELQFCSPQLRRSPVGQVCLPLTLRALLSALFQGPQKKHLVKGKPSVQEEL